MTPPPSPPSAAAIPPFVGLIVRVVTFICLVISLILVATNKQTVPTINGDVKFKSGDFNAYRYLVGTLIIGMLYTLLQTAFSIFLVSTGNRIGGDILRIFDFFGDMIISYFIVSGAAASFAVTRDFKQLQNADRLDKFTGTANAASSLCLIAFFFAAASCVFSAYSLPRRA